MRGLSLRLSRGGRTATPDERLSSSGLRKMNPCFPIELKMEAVVNEYFSVTFLQAWQFAKRVARYGSSNSR